MIEWKSCSCNSAGWLLRHYVDFFSYNLLLLPVTAVHSLVGSQVAALAADLAPLEYQVAQTRGVSPEVQTSVEDQARFQNRVGEGEQIPG
jgi:hypothetical protein